MTVSFLQNHQDAINEKMKKGMKKSIIHMEEKKTINKTTAMFLLFQAFKHVVLGTGLQVREARNEKKRREEKKKEVKWNQNN